MAATNPFSGTDFDFDPALHWGAFPAPATRTYTGEKVAGFNPAGEGIFSKRSGEKTLVGVVDAKRAVACMRWALGYSNTTASATYALQRTNPICHPKYTTLICTAATEHEFYPVRYAPLPPGATNSGLKLAKSNYANDKLLVVSANTGGEARTFPYYAGYSKAQVMLRFGPPSYLLKEDNTVPRSAGSGEYLRNTVVDTEPRTEVLTLSGFTMKYAEGESNTGPVSNPKGQEFPADIGQLLIKPDVKVTWYDVPEKFLFSGTSSPYQRYPAKILRGLGTLNQYDWLGFKKGTLLLGGARLTRYPWTLACGDGSGINDESLFNYDVELFMTYFNPTKGYTSNALIVDNDTYGWNCFPFKGVQDATPDKNAGRWFFATYNGTLTATYRTLYEYTSFSNLFDDVRNSDITSW